MTPATFKRHRATLGLSTKQLARLLDISELTIVRYEYAEDRTNNRPIPVATAELLLAWVEGYRGPRWRLIERRAA